MGWLWLGFILLIGLLLALDLGVFHRKAHVIPPGKALIWSGVWIGLALVFNLFLYFAYERHWLGLDLPYAEPDGQAAALAFFTGYILEKSLSVDNIFIIALVFAYFAVPPVYQHRLLYRGILAALLMRGAMILVGVALIEEFHWLLYGFGVILIVTAIRMLFAKEKRKVHENRLVQIVRKWFPITDDFEGQKFLVRRERPPLPDSAGPRIGRRGRGRPDPGSRFDPGHLRRHGGSVSHLHEQRLAILGLRSLYFALAHVLERLHYLDRSLAAILALIGAKMLFKDVLHGVPGIMLYTLGAIVLILAAGVIASLVWPRPQTAKD